MNGRSPNFNRGGASNRYYSGGTPNKGMNQPLHLAPNSPHLSPRGNFNRQSGSDNNSHSPDFIPIGYSSPLKAYRNSPNNNSWNQDRNNSSWNRGNTTNYQPRNSFSSTTSSPRSSVSSNYSPYNKFDNRKCRGGFNNSNSSNNKPISSYCDKSMLEDPWAECEQDFSANVADKCQTDEMSSDTEASSEGDESVSNEEN